MRRVIVIGATGSGKTTLARQISQQFMLPHTELDSLYWLPDWKPSPLLEFREKVATVSAGKTWVLDGNYSRVRDIVWAGADTLIWLDYPLWLVLRRSLKRGIQRIHFQEELWGTNNRETWRNLFFKRDSLLVWLFKTHGRHRREYPILFEQPEYVHLRVIHLQSPKAAKQWLERIKANAW
ncbi:MAG: adenylate kinase [Anaerolineae bacterium]|nr:adenylate kinase [Anaerolineae bacterium]